MRKVVNGVNDADNVPNERPTPLLNCELIKLRETDNLTEKSFSNPVREFLKKKRISIKKDRFHLNN